MNKFLLGGIVFLLAMALVGYLTPLNASLSAYSYMLLTLAENLGIILMLANGTFVRTRWFKFAIFLCGILVLGFLFRILHLQGGEQLFSFSFIGLFVVYLIHFVQKKSLIRNDILKLATAVGFLIVPSVVMWKVLPENISDVLVVISHVIFWFTFVDFLYSRRALFNFR